MELGLDFDDEDFEQNKKIKEPITSYIVKHCYPQWYNNEDQIDKITDKSDRSELLKFGADNFYHDGQYCNALQKYLLCLENLPHQFTPVWRDVKESISRCYMKLGRYTESEQIAQELLQRSDYILVKRQCVTLLFDIQTARNDNIIDQIQTLQRLIELDCCYAQHWYKLFTLYRRQTELSLPVIEEQYPYKVKAATCLVRTRFLRKAIHHQACDLVKQNNLVVLNQIQEDLDELNISNTTIDTIRSWMLSMKQEENEETDTTCDKLLSGKELEDKWFGWSNLTSTDTSVT